MKFIKKRKSALIFTLTFLVFFLGLFQNPTISYGQPQFTNETLTVESNFSFLEYSENNGNMENVTSINIDLKSSRWNVTDININFSSIKLGSEIKTIIDNPVESQSVEKFDGLGVQINISEATTLFGVYIYISKSSDEVDPVYVQINGFTDDGSNKPNETRYGFTLINVSRLEGWYFQNFTTPINLPKGNFYLVVNGTEHTAETKYRWFHDKDNPENFYTYTSEYSGNWKVGTMGEPFLYKLVQRVDKIYWPEDIEMALEVNGNDYYVKNGTSLGTGNVSIPNLTNYFPNNENLRIPIRNNNSIELLFNLSYNIKLDNNFHTDGSVLINENPDNDWSITPTFSRNFNNYTIKFDYPESWFNLNVNRSGANVTDDVTINKIDKYIIIPNNTLTVETPWLITAKSPNKNLYLNVPLTSLNPSQSFKFGVDSTDLQGNITFVLVDAIGFVEYNETRQITGDETLFSYTLPANAFEGIWKAFIFWNNLTDAGSEIININVVSSSGGGGGGGGGTTVVTGIDPQLIFMVILYVAIASLAGMSSYKMVKRHKRIKSEHREKVFNKYMDLLNLDYLMIIDKKSGLSVYDQILAGKERDSSLISGFLEAIRTFGIDLTGSEEESQTISLNYQNMNVIMNDFKNFRILNIMKESPSQDFLDSLRPLSHDIDTFYGKSLKNFDGNIAKFRGIKDLLENHLHTSLIYPLKVVKSKEIKLNSAEKSLTNKAQKMIKKNKTEYFYVSHLMGTSKEFNVKNAEIILNLIEKKVFRPIE